MKLEEIDLYVTNRCNLACDFCSVEARKKCSELSLDKIKDIIKEAKTYGLQELHLTGGEPTLRNDLEQIISFAVSQEINVRLISNGTTLSAMRLKELQNCGLNSIMISLDGTEKYHDSVRGKGSFQKSMVTIRNAIKFGMFVRVNSVAWCDNKESIKDLMSVLNGMGVAVYSIFLGSPLGYAQSKKNNIISPLQWKSFCEELKDVVHSNSYNTQIIVEKGFLYDDEEDFYINSLQGRGRGCSEIEKYTDFLLIRSNGEIFPCVFFSNEAPSIGNINDDSLGDILKNYKNNVFYKRIGSLPDQCIGCESLEICKGGCRGYSKLYTCDWFSKDPRCECGKEFIPLCPIVKYNLNEGIIGGSSEHVLK